MKALILGAGGFLGLNLVDALLAAQVVPRCGRRARSNVLGLRRRKVPLVAADLERPDELAAAMEGCDTIFHLAGHYPRLSLDPQGARATGLRQTRNVLAAAQGAGVRRLLYVSSTATVAPSPCGVSTEADVFKDAPGYGTYHDLKWAMEDCVLGAEGLEVCGVLPGACLGPGDLRVGTSALLVGLARGMEVPHPEGMLNLVDVRDVATALVRLAWHPNPPRRVILSAQNAPLHLLLLALSERYQVPPPPLPLTAHRAIELADAQEAAASLRGGRPQLSREIVDLIVHGVPLDARLAEATLGMRWTPLEVTLDAFDTWARRMTILPQPPLKETHA